MYPGCKVCQQLLRTLGCSPSHKLHLCSRNQKRKYEDDHGAEHGNFDMTEIREHEEFTKVKNIERIELGRYEMETWYFSPFPEEFKNCTVRQFWLLLAPVVDC
jgi:hypothetical protein